MKGIEYIQNGQGFGQIAEMMMEGEFDPLAMRPWKSVKNRLPYIAQPVIVHNEHQRDKDGKLMYRPVCVANTGTIASLRMDDWRQIDDTIMRVAKQRLRLVSDLRSRGLQYVIPDGFGKTVLTYEDMSDITEAEIGMDPNIQGKADQPGFGSKHMPLPIVFKDFWLSTRAIRASRNGGSPLDLTTAELAARRVAELVEKLALGVAPSYVFGGQPVYGLTNFTGRLTKALTLPTAPGWTGTTLLNEILAMREQAQVANHYGPFVVYLSQAWDKYMDADFSTAKGDVTLRNRIKMVDGIEDVRTLDYLNTGYQVILLEMSQDVVREVVGMDITTVQWMPTPFRVHFKVLGILVPQVRADQVGNTGIVHGVAA
jgi:uncharacterized linocin/CFP29 family protein